MSVKGFSWSHQCPLRTFNFISASTKMFLNTVWLLRLNRIWHHSSTLSCRDRWRGENLVVFCVCRYMSAQTEWLIQSRLTVPMSPAGLPWQCQCHVSSRGSGKQFAKGLKLIPVEPYTNMLEWNHTVPFRNLQKKSRGPKDKGIRRRKIAMVNR